jgi:hypothetical protein
VRVYCSGQRFYASLSSGVTTSPHLLYTTRPAGFNSVPLLPEASGGVRGASYEERRRARSEGEGDAASREGEGEGEGCWAGASSGSCVCTFAQPLLV